MIQFSFPWKKYLMAIIFLTLFILEWQYHYSADWIAITIDKLVWLFSIIIVIYACYQKRKGAYIVLCGLLISLPIPSLLFSVQIPFVSAYDVSIFIIFFIIILSMLYVRTLKMRAEQKAYEASLVLSERLKNELLKKNIKPHFIMNTLTSLIDWVEESPKEGVKFIHALAGEFEVLNQIADYKQVPIGQEIKLCKSHLEVMSYRKEIAYKWEDKGIDPNDIIPPAIIHTAVENGVTHSLPDENGVITFRLVFEKNKTFKKYTLLTIAKNRTASASEKVKEVEGTGLKYIKARLQESYPDNWKINSKATDEGWETSIKIMEP
ncbi:MAG: LytS/YehU family sensor histidine kinase [Saprospiraceae bacterium]|jgi:LytS/YehU family sensor histidine kinase